VEIYVSLRLGTKELLRENDATFTFIKRE